MSRYGFGNSGNVGSAGQEVQQQGGGITFGDNFDNGNQIGQKTY